MADPAVPAVVDLRPVLAARRKAVDNYDVVTLSLVLMLLLDGADEDSREMLAESHLTGDQILELGAAGTRLGELAPRVVRGRRR